MSMTSTARKATTLFFSFFLFSKLCTVQHVVGMFIFMGALVLKSLTTRKEKRKDVLPMNYSDGSGGNRKKSDAFDV
jgi:hypothetical protein